MRKLGINEIFTPCLQPLSSYHGFYSPKMSLSEIIQIQYISDEINYGAFAKIDIKNNTLLAEYTGIFT